MLQLLLGAEPSALNPRVSLPTSVAVLDFTLDTIDIQDMFHSAIWLVAVGGTYKLDLLAGGDFLFLSC